MAFISCFGPVSGLRTMILCRYSWGYYGASIMSILNILNVLCWLSINSITGGQMLRVVSNDYFPLSIGIILIGIISMIISFVGYKWIHMYERYSWIPQAIIFFIIGIIVINNFPHCDQVNIRFI